MTQEDSGYEMKPVEKAEAPAGGMPGAAPKPGEPGWVPPVPVVEKAEASEESPVEDPDVEKNKGMAILAYVCFIVPLVAAPKSKYARFHANQGLLVFICWCVAILGNVALYLFDTKVMDHMKNMAVLYGFFWCAISVLEVGVLIGALALTLYGIIQAANGQWKGLPGVGQMTLIK